MAEITKKFLMWENLFYQIANITYSKAMLIGISIGIYTKVIKQKNISIYMWTLE